MSSTIGSLPQQPQRRFAPLNADVKNDAEAPVLKGIVFDVDGTLWYVLLWSLIEGEVFSLY